MKGGDHSRVTSYRAQSKTRNGNYGDQRKSWINLENPSVISVVFRDFR